MSIPLVCSHCEHAFYVNDQWLGKRIKCPQCQERLDVGGGQGQDPLSDFLQWSAGGNSVTTTADDVRWYLQTSTGRQYGPVDRRLLDYWKRLGAISARSQVLREGDDQWRWASELYPELGEG
jgi:hypothetical protein